MKQEDDLSQIFKFWKEITAKYPNIIVLIKVGDYYSTFGADAVTLSELIAIELRVEENQKYCRFLFHQLDTILIKLVKAGHKVAVCEQL